MRGTFKFVKPDELEASLTLTMTIGEWRKLRDQLTANQHPSWKIQDLVREIITAAERQFYQVDPPPPAET